MREKSGKTGTMQERHREIFYDTDNIFERQKEKITICRECAGALGIDSHAMPGSRAMAVHIPPNACHACVEAGYDMFEQAGETKKYSQLFLQDRPKDQYIIKSR